MFSGVFNTLNNGIKNNCDIAIIIIVIQHPIIIEPATDFLSNFISSAP